MLVVLYRVRRLQFAWNRLRQKAKRAQTEIGLERENDDLSQIQFNRIRDRTTIANPSRSSVRS